MRSVTDSLIELENSRKKQKTDSEKFQLEGYEELDQKKHHLQWTPPPEIDQRLTFIWRTAQPLVTIFKFFINEDILTKIIDNLSYDELIIRYNHPWHHNTSINELYVILSITIRIYALHRVPQKIARNGAPLREAIQEAKNHFSGINPAAYIPGINIIEKLIAIPLFPTSLYEDISKNFQRAVLQIGESAAGDEKLFHFTGKSRDIRLVPSKPGRIGFWNYELCAPLSFNGQFLLHTRMAYGGEGLPVHEVVRKWAQIIKQYEKNDTLLTFDSYYLCNASRVVLNELSVKFVASFNVNRFRDLKGLMSSKVNNPGDWTAVYHPGRLESIVYHWSNDDVVGKKWVMSNCCEKHVLSKNINSLPLFDLYKKTFNICDLFNTSLSGKSWPHRKGGYTRFGAQGAQHDFIFTCILINTVNTWSELSQVNHKNVNFQEAYLQLADELFMSVSPNI